MTYLIKFEIEATADCEVDALYAALKSLKEDGGCQYLGTAEVVEVTDKRLAS